MRGETLWRQNEAQSVRLGEFNRAVACRRQHDAVSVRYREIKRVANMMTHND
jgi:hypothetical protein